MMVCFLILGKWILRKRRQQNQIDTLQSGVANNSRGALNPIMATNRTGIQLQHQIDRTSPSCPPLAVEDDKGEHPPAYESLFDQNEQHKQLESSS